MEQNETLNAPGHTVQEFHFIHLEENELAKSTEFRTSISFLIIKTAHFASSCFRYHSLFPIGIIIDTIVSVESHFINCLSNIMSHILIIKIDPLGCLVRIGPGFF